MRILITAGPTHEAIDPVRYIANRSSGAQGSAIAEALAAENPSLVTVLRGEPLPEGWFGKPWACW